MIPSELPRPLNDDDFERMCADVYAEVFQSRRPQQFGRRGQRQSGIDAILHVDDDLVAVQAKRYNTKKFDRAVIESEIRKVDQSDLNIRELLIATTAPSDNRVLSWVEKISAQRQKQGLFKVTIEFWEDITAHIRRYEVLSRKYDIRYAAEVRCETQQHTKDVEALRKVFSALNVPILEQHIHEFPSTYRFDTALLYDRFFGNPPIFRAR